MKLREDMTKGLKKTDSKGSSPTKSTETPRDREHQIAEDAEVDADSEVQEQLLTKAALLYSAQSYSAPLPPPSMLEGYERALPGAAERIFVWVEGQSAHRQSLEKQRLDAEIKAEARGQHYGLAISLTVIAAGCILIWNGKDIAGLSLIIANLAALVAAFFLGQRQQRKQEKDLLQDVLDKQDLSEIADRLPS
jgi:uncharacterized membrane protein